MIGGHLAIDHLEIFRAEEGDEFDKGELRGASALREHRLAEEDAVEGDAVKPAHQFSGKPALHRVCIAEAVHFDIGLLHRRSDPGAGFSRGADFGAGSDDFREGAVAAGAYVRVASIPLETSWSSELHREQHQARVGGPPEQGVSLGEPGENALAVGEEQTLWREVAAYRQEAVVFRQMGGWKEELSGESEDWHGKCVVVMVRRLDQG